MTPEPNKPMWSQMLFRFFLRKLMPELQANNEECNEISKLFQEYLQARCTPTQLANFVPESEIQVMLQQDHPLKMSGFDPAFVLHFTNFIEEQAAIQRKELQTDTDLTAEQMAELSDWALNHGFMMVGKDNWFPQDATDEQQFDTHKMWLMYQATIIH